MSVDAERGKPDGGAVERDLLNTDEEVNIKGGTIPVTPSLIAIASNRAVAYSIGSTSGITDAENAKKISP